MVRRRSFSIDDEELNVLDKIATMAASSSLPMAVRNFIGDELERTGLGRYSKIYTRSRVLRAILLKRERMLDAEE